MRCESGWEQQDYTVLEGVNLFYKLIEGIINSSVKVYTNKLKRSVDHDQFILVLPLTI
jgi:hypothetical protein